MSRMRQQFVEVVRADGATALEALVVHREALDQVLAQPFGGPAPELGAAVGAHAVADGDDHVEVVEGNLVVLPVRGSC